jgi:hypothetical protein
MNPNALTPEQEDRLKQLVEDVAQIKTALIGKITADASAPGLIHITQALQRAVFHESTGLVVRVEAIEKYKIETKGKWDVGSAIARAAFTACVIAAWEIIKAWLIPGKKP